MPAGSGIPTEVTNFTWSAFFGLLAVVINGTGLGIWLKTRPNMKKLDVDADESLRLQLLNRLDKVEAQLEKEREERSADRRELENRIERQRELYEAKLETERARHEAAEMLSRHKVRNLEQCLSAFLWMAEKRPDNIPEVVAEIRRMRAEQEAAEAAEKGAVAGARIVAAGPKGEPT